MVRSARSVVIPAARSGKIKTVLQAFALAGLTWPLPHGWTDEGAHDGDGDDEESSDEDRIGDPGRSTHRQPADAEQGDHQQANRDERLPGWGNQPEKAVDRQRAGTRCGQVV